MRRKQPRISIALPLAVLFAACVSGPAGAAGPRAAVTNAASALPPQLAAFVAEAREQCVSGQGRFSVPPPVLRGSRNYSEEADLDHDGRQTYYDTADFNGDGRPDYVLTPAFDCTFTDEDGSTYGASFFAAGQCGVSYSFLISTPSGYRPDGEERDGEPGMCATIARLTSADGRPVLELDAGRGDLFRVYGWNGSRIALLYYLHGNERVDANGRPIPAQRAAPAGVQWQVARTEDGLAAYVFAPPAITAAIFRCERGAAIFHLNLAGDEGGASRTIEFVGSSSGMRARETFGRRPDTGQWAAAVGEETVALFAGADPAVELRLNGRPLATLPLRGSSTAIRTALAGCPGARQEPAPAAAARPPAPSGPLGIAPGLYVAADEPCERASYSFFYDGTHIGERFAGSPAWTEPLGSVERSPDGSVFIESRGIEVDKLPGGRIRLVIQDDGPPLRWCPAAVVPPRLR